MGGAENPSWSGPTVFFFIFCFLWENTTQLWSGRRFWSDPKPGQGLPRKPRRFVARENPITAFLVAISMEIENNIAGFSGLAGLIRDSG